MYCKMQCISMSGQHLETIGRHYFQSPIANCNRTLEVMPSYCFQLLSTEAVHNHVEVFVPELLVVPVCKNKPLKRTGLVSQINQMSCCSPLRVISSIIGYAMRRSNLAIIQHFRLMLVATVNHSITTQHIRCSCTYRPNVYFAVLV